MLRFKATKTQKLSLFCKDFAGELPYALLMKCLRKKDVKINGKRISTDVIVNLGDEVCIYAPTVEVKRYSLVYADDNIVVVDKSSGITSEELFEGLKAQYNPLYFIHRLDRNTSGIMVFARNDRAEQELINGFKNRTFEKKYLAEVFGRVEKNNQVLSAYLFKDAKSATVKVYDTFKKGSTPIKTGFSVIERRGDTTLLEVTLLTGKTHQIRAHLAHIGHFIVGDGKYGDNQFNRLKNAKYQKLVAYKLTLKFEDDSLLSYLNNKTFMSKGEID